MQEFHLICKAIKLRESSYDQLFRASQSIALNIAEGSGRRTDKDQARCYGIALGSLRECQALIDLSEINDPRLEDLGDQLGAILHKMSRRSNHKDKSLLKTDTD